MKNVAMKPIKTRPKIATMVNTKPEATLFCKKDVLELALAAGREGIEDDSTTRVVVRVTGEDDETLELLSIEEVVVLVDEVEEGMEEERLLNELADIDWDEVKLRNDVVLELEELPLLLVLSKSGNRGSKGLLIEAHKRGNI